MFRGLTSVLAIAMLGMAQAAWALGCMPILLVEPEPGATGRTNLSVAAPGEPGYDAQAYGAHLYDVFVADAANNEETVLLIGRIEPVEGPEAEFMHEVLYQDYALFPRDTNFGVRPSNIRFHYQDAFQFEGLALLGVELTEQSEVLLDFDAYLAGEYISPVPSYAAPVMFRVRLHQNERMVYSPGLCPWIAPAPDDAALAVLMACVEDGGCAGE